MGDLTGALRTADTVNSDQQYASSPAHRSLAGRVLHSKSPLVIGVNSTTRHQASFNAVRALLTRANHLAMSAVSANFPLRPSNSKTLTGSLPWRNARRKVTADLKPSARHNSEPPIIGPNWRISSLSSSKSATPPCDQPRSFAAFECIFHNRSKPWSHLIDQLLVPYDDDNATR